jgi:hypothetical protein
MTPSESKAKKNRPVRCSIALPADLPVRGHRSFRSAFEEALQVSDVGVSPREIRVRWNRSDDSYTWSIRF